MVRPAAGEAVTFEELNAPEHRDGVEQVARGLADDGDTPWSMFYHRLECEAELVEVSAGEGTGQPTPNEEVQPVMSRSEPDQAVCTQALRSGSERSAHRANALMDDGGCVVNPGGVFQHTSSAVLATGLSNG